MNQPSSGFALPLPPGFAFVQQRMRRVVQALPVEPPSFVAARVLDRLLLPRLPADSRRLLAEHGVEIEVTDLGLRVRLVLGAAGFRVASRATPVVLAIRAPIASYVRLLRGQEDPDRLFFERQLVMEGDTELGLVLKNTLDAIGPLI